MNDHDTTMSSFECVGQMPGKLSDTNKGLVFDALAAAKITSVLVEFDGGGDDSQVKSTIAKSGESPVDLPATNISMQRISWGDTETSIKQMSIAQAIQELCYNYLEQNFGEPECDGGAYGEFCFDVAERTVTLYFNSPFADVHETILTF